MVIPGKNNSYLNGLSIKQYEAGNEQRRNSYGGKQGMQLQGKLLPLNNNVNFQKGAYGTKQWLETVRRK